MPVGAAAETAREAVRRGLGGILLFGLPRTKDARGSSALDPDGPVPRAVAEMKAAAPDLIVVTDVCVDEYTDHGHCGLLRKAANGALEVDNDATLEVLAQMAVVHARAGADVIAPSDMMDGRVARIRRALDSSGEAAGVAAAVAELKSLAISVKGDKEKVASVASIRWKPVNAFASSERKLRKSH